MPKRFGGYGGLASSRLKRNRTDGRVKPTKYNANKNTDATLAKQTIKIMHIIKMTSKKCIYKKFSSSTNYAHT